MSRANGTSTNHGANHTPKGREPSVLFIGRGRDILAASPSGMQFVHTAASWVARGMCGGGGPEDLSRAVMTVLTGKAPRVRVEGPTRGKNSAKQAPMWILPAHDPSSNEIVGAIVIREEQAEAPRAAVAKPAKNGRVSRLRAA